MRLNGFFGDENVVWAVSAEMAWVREGEIADEFEDVEAGAREELAHFGRRVEADAHRLFIGRFGVVVEDDGAFDFEHAREGFDVGFFEDFATVAHPEEAQGHVVHDEVAVDGFDEEDAAGF